jgi:hypothetical protein
MVSRSYGASGASRVSGGYITSRVRGFR